MIASLSALLAASASTCVPVPGAEKLWQPATRWIIVGEMHGTNETPAAFTNLVCLASDGDRPVTVALEYSADWQPAIDRYLASDGGTEARSDLLALPVWGTGFPDGRGSTAFLRMLEDFRRMKQAGQIDGVVCTDVGANAPAGETRDAYMARAWTSIQAPENAIILALVGNVHAMRNAMIRPSHTIITAGSLMPSARTLTINVAGNGGKAWNCQEDCGPHDNGRPRTASSGIVFSKTPDVPWGAVYELGVPTTAAPPANPTEDG